MHLDKVLKIVEHVSIIDSNLESLTHAQEYCLAMSGNMDRKAGFIFCPEVSCENCIFSMNNLPKIREINKCLKT